MSEAEVEFDERTPFGGVTEEEYLRKAALAEVEAARQEVERSDRNLAAAKEALQEAKDGNKDDPAYDRILRSAQSHYDYLKDSPEQARLRYEAMKEANEG